MSIEVAFVQFPNLQTERIILRAMQPSDASALFIIKSDRAVMDFYGDEPHHSPAETVALIEDVNRSFVQ